MTALPRLVLADVPEEQQLVPTANADAFAGTSSAVFGATAVVGAPGDTGDAMGCATGAGAAYVYTRSGMMWTKAATLCASDGSTGDGFGTSVSIYAGNIAVGAPGKDTGTGAVYVYSGSGSTWTENATILDDGAVDGGALGSAVSIQGFRVAAGAPSSDVPGPHGSTDTGIVIVYTSSDNGASWTHTTFHATGGQARVSGYFGSALALSGSTILVGTPGFHTGQKSNSGAVFVFANVGSLWTQQQRIRPSNSENFFAGAAVSLFQNIGAFGAPGANTVYIYKRNSNNWSPQGSATAGSAGDMLGSSVAIQGNPISVVTAGAPAANGGAGRAYEFGSSGGPLTLLNELVPDTAPSGGDNFGWSAGFEDGRAIIGSPNSGTLTQGSAHIFKLLNTSTTAITGIVNAGDFSMESLTGVPYTVFVSVSDPDTTTTPTGSVHIDDSNGGGCDAALSEDSTGVAVGMCDLTSNFFGFLTINASYGGDPDFAASTDARQHKVTGNHFVFDPDPPDVLQGSQETGVVVKLLNGADQVINDSTTQVTVMVMDTCGEQNTIGTLTLTNGIADFSNLGPRFYTATTNDALNYTAQQSPYDIGTSPTSTTSASFDVTANPDFIYFDGFEQSCL